MKVYGFRYEDAARHVTDPDFLPEIDALLSDLGSCFAAEEGLARIALADLLAWRERELHARRDTERDPAPADIKSCDTAWFDRLRRADDDVLCFRIGIGAKDTVLDEILKHLDEISGRSRCAVEMRHGINEGLQRTFAFGGRRQEPALSHVEKTVSRIARTTDTLAPGLLRGVASGLSRKSLLRHLNAMVLLEEASLLVRTGLRGDEKVRRRTAIEHALSRYLGGLSDISGASLEEITQVLRTTGNAARLNHAISDGLDRVQAYAGKASADPDMAEAGRAAGRPLPDNPRDLYAATLQCRKFRDRERA